MNCCSLRSTPDECHRERSSAPELHVEPGAELVVCARWCPTLPHPGGCSTIGAVRLSFRVRDGYRAFPCRCDHRDDWLGSALPSSGAVIRLSVWLPPLNHARCVCVCVVGGWVGCGPYSGRFALTFFHRPRVWGCCCLCWPISTSQLTDRCRSSTPGLSTQ